MCLGYTFNVHGASVECSIVGFERFCDVEKIRDCYSTTVSIIFHRTPMKIYHGGGVPQSQERHHVNGHRLEKLSNHAEEIGEQGC